MSNTTFVFTRLRMSSLGIAGLGGAWTTSCSAREMTQHTAVVAAYQPSADSRNAAKGGASAWGPPV